MKPIVVDYESYYVKDGYPSANTQGNDNYVRDSYAYMVSIADGNTVECGTIEEMGPMMDQIVKDPTVQLWAANSNFDQRWSDKLHGPSVRPWKCILDRAAHAQMPRHLQGVAKVVLNKKIDKTIRDQMSGKHYRDLNDQQKEELLNYCADDAQDEYEILMKLPEMSSIEEDIAEMTRWQNRTGVAINKELVQEDKTALEEVHWKASLEIPWRENEKLLSPKGLADWCRVRGLTVPKSTEKEDPECERLMQQSPEFARVVEAMRVVRSSNMFLTKAQSVLDRLREDGTIPLDLLYCGAPHTRRWSSQGVNVQNLPRAPIVFTLGSEEWEIYPRWWIVPRAGHIFGINDYSQIEPRVLNWYVGNTELLDMLKKGFPLYEAYARSVGWWKQEGSLKKLNEALYTKTKNQVLGLGYGMGADRYAAENGLDREDACEQVNDFRRRNTKITGLWKKGDQLIDMAMASTSKHLKIRLPSGDYYQLFNLRRSKFGFSGMKLTGSTRPDDYVNKLWGGTFTENITQRMARDILAEGAVRCWKAGIQIRFTSHDEAVSELPIASKDADFAEMARLMKIAPEWAAGVPLAVDGGFSERYTKL